VKRDRLFPSGSSVVGEMANSSFWIGIMSGLGEIYSYISQVIEFDFARDNFMSASHDGLNTSFPWLKGKKISATELIKEELIPIAKEELKANCVNKNDIDRLLGVIEARCETGQTGAQWTLNSQQNLQKTTNKEEIIFALTSAMIENQKSGKLVYERKLADIENIKGWQPYAMLVEGFMTTDVFTVHENDLPDLVADVMVW
jgi:hypothetical protein